MSSPEPKKLNPRQEMFHTLFWSAIHVAIEHSNPHAADAGSDIANYAVVLASEATDAYFETLEDYADQEE